MIKVLFFVNNLKTLVEEPGIDYRDDQLVESGIYLATFISSCQGSQQGSNCLQAKCRTIHLFHGLHSNLPRKLCFWHHILLILRLVNKVRKFAHLQNYIEPYLHTT